MSLVSTLVLVRSGEARHEVKKSIFVAFAEPLAEPEQAVEFLERHSDDNARHHCWAWRCNGEYRFSDDGEPAGTAGRPILQAIEGAELDRTFVVVRRYFGGIKLGAGGLVRAYSAAAAACLSEAPSRRLTPHVELELTVPFEHTQALFQAGSTYYMSPPEHRSSGVTITALIPVDRCDTFLDDLLNHTRGQLQCHRGATRLA